MSLQNQFCGRNCRSDSNAANPCLWIFIFYILFNAIAKQGVFENESKHALTTLTKNCKYCIQPYVQIIQNSFSIV